LGTLLLIVGMIASEQFAQYAQYAMQGMQLLFLSFSRDDETQADQLGVEYSSKMGFDAQKMADFFRVLEKMNLEESQGGVPTWMSTHPDPGDRQTAVRAMALQWQDSLKLPTWKVNTESYLNLIDGIIYGEDPRQGYTEGNTFYHPELKFKFSFPTAWKLENTPTQVNMAPADGKALIAFLLSRQTTLTAARDSALAAVGLQLQRSEERTVNGMPALVTLSKLVNEDRSTGTTSTNIFLSYFIHYGSVIYTFHGISTEADFPNYSGVMESSMKSFAKLTDASKINVKPQRVYVKKVQQTGTLANAFSSYGVPQDKMSNLALLNNLELTDQVKAGKLIKIVGD
jgi:predicted Zn-dependent protease